MRIEIRKSKVRPQRNDTRPIPEKAEGHIMQVSYDQSVCAGCGTCEVMCALVHDGVIGPMRQRIWVDRNEFEGFPTVLACHQCDAPECYFACTNEALLIDPKTHARYIDEEKCVGCMKCRDACVFDPPRINYDPARDKSLKCDLCKDRIERPVCVDFCPQKALVLTVKEVHHDV